MEFETAEYVEHDFDRELVDWQGVELLELKTGLEALFNLGVACGAMWEGGVWHRGWGRLGRRGTEAARCSGRCTRIGLLEWLGKFRLAEGTAAAG